MRVHTDGAVAGLTPSPIGDTSPRAPFLDFTMPAVLADPWVSSKEDVIASAVAVLTLKEQQTFRLLRAARRARTLSGALMPDALQEAERHFAEHGDALGSLYVRRNFPIGRGLVRLRRWLMRAFHAGATMLMPTCASYSARLNDLYAAASDLSIGYVTLQATALSLGDRCAAAVAARHLRDLGQLLLTLHNLVPYEFVFELKAKGLKASTDDLWEVAGVTTQPS